ncbi:hypothetical protein GNIT_0202 [Glaciecola nitratireducens FR1064]|uniref:Uncharacterized protein n=1 Tax=Glaciecola nitratireducens (strain JCM 12485 / KCTC 12276 / FR1064) TaxID=1085623 RepID=G4QF12_GLANF|nr:hypothetical protein GNIT_0202 [Glaciecola nitratireducens FR1064]
MVSYTFKLSDNKPPISQENQSRNASVSAILQVNKKANLILQSIPNLPSTLDN